MSEQTPAMTDNPAAAIGRVPGAMQAAADLTSRRDTTRSWGHLASRALRLPRDHLQIAIRYYTTEALPYVSSDAAAWRIAKAFHAAVAALPEDLPASLELDEMWLAQRLLSQTVSELI